ncbi:MAG: undecaprenyl-phosphate glucose phosphotransferase [Bacteroidetes bacterium]|nr:undecaprenyl-phosphate glucose phosphotransferase [Bacteroidota bacterium]
MKQKKQNDVIIPLLTILADVVTIELSFLLAYWLRFYSPLTYYIPVTLGIPPLEAYVKASLYTLPIWIWLFKRRGLYKQRRITHFSDEFFSIIRIVVLALLLIAGAAFFYREFSYSRGVYILVGVVALVLLTLVRYGMFHFERWWYKHGHDVKNILIIGTGEHAKSLFNYFNLHPELGYTPKGIVDKPPVETIPELLRTQHIDTIILTFSSTEHSEIYEIVRACEGMDVEIMFVPTILDVMTSQVRIQYFERTPLLSIKTPALSTWNRFVKRVFDIIFSLFVLVVLAPLYLLIIVLIKLDSKGPIFYLQERIGLDGKVFHVIKFRSMKVDAEKETGPVWAKKDDPRTTRVGKFLRRFSLDELPQFINVLKGDMSIVGPRPERPFFVEQFRKEIPKYLDRHRVKTGMTGWAQVNGLRGNAPIAERTKYDLYYIENWSLVFDLKIIAKTVYAVLFGKDAY